MLIKLIQPRMTMRPMDSIIKPRMAPSLGLLTLAALTPPEHQIVIQDENVRRLTLDDSPDLVGITANVDNALRAYQIAERLPRPRHPGRRRWHPHQRRPRGGAAAVRCHLHRATPKTSGATSWQMRRPARSSLSTEAHRPLQGRGHPHPQARSGPGRGLPLQQHHQRQSRMPLQVRVLLQQLPLRGLPHRQPAGGRGHRRDQGPRHPPCNVHRRQPHRQSRPGPGSSSPPFATSNWSSSGTAR